MTRGFSSWRAASPSQCPSCASGSPRKFRLAALLVVQTICAAPQEIVLPIALHGTPDGCSTSPSSPPGAHHPWRGAKEVRFAGEEVTSEDRVPKVMRSKTALVPQLTIRELPPFAFKPGPCGADALGECIRVGGKARYAAANAATDRAAGPGVGVLKEYPVQWGGRRGELYPRSIAAADLEIARQHADFKQELERLSAELSVQEFWNGAPARPRLHLRERLNGLLSDGSGDELGFKRDFAAVDLVALRERFLKGRRTAQAESHKAFLRRMMHKARLPDRLKAGMEYKLLGPHHRFRDYSRY
ncbi:hypothetical protein KFL_004630010 [Klebsormidium nitens]|uniref:Uncharacterized protein n=1 Tax=Klebsormidium nitens TaxID=105231 RepID=A0A1Y1ID02_KLENI|nr:hypothetical protein KFL_004630010 [Klebsormidium nitens]|eukprot:GAQ88834.1 hypothetical protein KFL_004630010 [Klebsormidium nitens]